MINGRTDVIIKKHVTFVLLISFTLRVSIMYLNKERSMIVFFS